MPRTAKHPKSCHERALGLLAVRARSRRELQGRLRQAGFEAAEIEDVLERLGRVGLVDDAAFARQVAEHRFGIKNSGARAVSHELLAKGVSTSLVAEIVGEADAGEEDRADALARTRASRLRTVEPAKAFQRLSSLLMRRGFGPETARRAARKALEVEATEE